MAKVFIGIGSNLGEPLKQCQGALEHLGQMLRAKIIQTSSFYESEPLVMGIRQTTPWYVNAVCEMETSLSPVELLKQLIHIEEEMGRVRTEKWESRLIDLDILFYDNQVIDEKDLIIPHPEIQNRRFVLEPLCEIVPQWEHPILKKTARDLLKMTKDTLSIEKIFERD